MVREELISSAVNFLQDPSVSASPLDKRIAFLQAKNLTQEEVDVALARAGEGSQSPNASFQSTPSASYGPASQAGPRQPIGYGYPYQPYQAGPWGPPPPQPPRRDWRDWFIMATVTTGVGYGLYAAAQRYIIPLIAPPTPPQLEQDKASIDESFNKAFALIDQLAADTADLKASEAERTEKLDSTLKEVDTAVADLKAANARREAESRIIADQVQGLKDFVPKALEGWKANGDARLDDLSQEMQSLKRLLENRVGKPPGTSTPVGRGNVLHTSNGNNNATDDASKNDSRDSHAVSVTESSNGPPSPVTNAAVPKGDVSPLKRSGQGSDRRAAIPAWQMAASAKAVDNGDDETKA